MKNIHPVDDFNQVVTTEGRAGNYRKTPCEGCPWLKENDGSFPAEAFRHSASTAYDMATNKFGCHDSGTSKPATCAGFLLRGAEHNMQVRLDYLTGRIVPALLKEGESPLHGSYFEMAVANGVDPDDSVLKRCR